MPFIHRFIIQLLSYVFTAAIRVNGIFNEWKQIHRGNLKEVSMNYFNKIKERKITDQPKKNERFISAEPVVAKPINKTDHHFNDNKNELFENEKFLKGSKKYDENIPIANIKPFDIECNVQLHNDNVETQSHTKYKSALGSQSSSNNSSLEESSPSESHSHGNGNGNYNANGNDNDNHKEPPTPLPRSSRQSSLKDDQEEIAIVRPVARPRTTATYKVDSCDFFLTLIGFRLIYYFI